MRKTLMLIFILLVSFAFVHAQDKPNAYKFAEFGDVQESVWKARLDRFSEMLISQPNAKLHIIVYAELGKSRHTIEKPINQYTDYLQNAKKLKLKNFGIKRGGFRNSQSAELWIVPKDGEMPNPTPVENFMAEKFLEFREISDEELKKHAEKFSNLVYETFSEGVIMIYGSKSEFESIFKRLQDIFPRRYIYSGPRIIFTNIDSSNSKTVFWVVPIGEPIPAP